MASSMAARTSGFLQFRSGCSGRKAWRYDWPVASSRSQAGPPKSLIQLLGAAPSGPASRQTYQSRLGLVRDERLSTNHGCRSDVWFGT